MGEQHGQRRADGDQDADHPAGQVMQGCDHQVHGNRGAEDAQHSAVQPHSALLREALLTQPQAEDNQVSQAGEDEAQRDEGQAVKLTQPKAGRGQCATVNETEQQHIGDGVKGDH